MYLGFYLWQKYMACITVVSKELLWISPHINTWRVIIFAILFTEIWNTEKGI